HSPPVKRTWPFVQQSFADETSDFRGRVGCRQADIGCYGSDAYPLLSLLISDAHEHQKLACGKPYLASETFPAVAQPACRLNETVNGKAELMIRLLLKHFRQADGWRGKRF